MGRVSSLSGHLFNMADVYLCRKLEEDRAALLGMGVEQQTRLARTSSEARRFKRS